MARKMEDGSGIGSGIEFLRVGSAVTYTDGGDRDLLRNFWLRSFSAIAFPKASSLMGARGVGWLSRFPEPSKRGRNCPGTGSWV